MGECIKYKVEKTRLRGERKKRKKRKKERNILYSNKDKLKTGADIRVSTLRGVLRNRDSQVIM